MGTYFGLLNHGVKKRRKGRRVLFVLLQMARAHLSKAGSGVSIIGISVEGRRLVFFLHKRVRALNFEKDVVLGRCLEPGFIKVRADDVCHRWSAFAQLFYEREPGRLINIFPALT